LHADIVSCEQRAPTVEKAKVSEVSSISFLLKPLFDKGTALILMNVD